MRKNGLFDEKERLFLTECARRLFFNTNSSRVWQNIITFATMFEKEISEYEALRQEYQQKVADRMGREQWMEYNEILFSAHSCAIEGNSFTVDDTRILREQGMAMVPVGRSLPMVFF